MRQRRQKVAVAGAGLAGMFAAAALAQAGCEVVVCERAAALGEAGAGIQISPNGARLLARLGALDAVRAAGFAPEAAEIRDGRTGWPILRLPLGDAAVARWGAPYLQAHRADLLVALETAARAAGVRVRLGTAAAGAIDGALLLEDGGAIEADVVVGADGLRSAVRERLFGPQPPRFAGAVAWRATVPAAAVPAGTVPPAAVVWAGPGRHLVTYPLRGGDLLNLVAVEARGGWAEESWSQPGDPDEMRRAFAGFRPRALLEAVGSCLLWGLFDRPPLPAWAVGRTALIGDAAHPMPPYMAQGAVQGFEDGAALARLLPSAADPAQALAVWEAARRPRAERVQARARANAALFHAAGAARALRQGPVALASRLAPALAAARLDWLYGHVEPTW